MLGCPGSTVRRRHQPMGQVDISIASDGVEPINSCRRRASAASETTQKVAAPAVVRASCRLIRS